MTSTSTAATVTPQRPYTAPVVNGRPRLRFRHAASGRVDTANYARIARPPYGRVRAQEWS